MFEHVGQTDAPVRLVKGTHAKRDWRGVRHGYTSRCCSGGSLCKTACDCEGSTILVREAITCDHGGGVEVGVAAGPRDGSSLLARAAQPEQQQETCNGKVKLRLTVWVEKVSNHACSPKLIPVRQKVQSTGTSQLERVFVVFVVVEVVVLVVVLVVVSSLSKVQIPRQVLVLVNKADSLRLKFSLNPAYTAGLTALLLKAT